MTLPTRSLHPLAKFLLELGPLGIFFFANQRVDIYFATAVFIGATIVALAIHYALTQRFAIMPLVSGVLVTVFGGLTLWLQDDTFIKIKPTIINTLFGTALLVGLAFNKPLLGVVFDGVVDLTPIGWRKLTLRWGVFLLALAVLNEVVWRTQTTDAWVSFKVFGMMPLTVGFALLQTPLILRHDAASKSTPSQQ